jgi:hypothetical protein
MFSFLNPALLVAALAALIPLIIHLFSRRRLKIIEFSSLKHLQAMQKRQVRRLKIRQLLLLILRMLIILLIVLAFARPTSTGGNIGSHASVAAVIIFDNSASMNREVSDGNLFELAKKRTNDLLDNFGEADDIAILPVVRPDLPTGDVSFSSAATVKEQLSQLVTSAGRVDFAVVLENARNLLESAAQVNKELYLVTDLQRRLLPESPLLRDLNAEVYLVDFEIGLTENCGITKVDFGGELLMPGQEFTITTSVKNYGDQDRPDIIASLYLDGRRVAQTDVQVDAGRETTVLFATSLSRGGFHSGYIELSDDAFAGDNRYYFSLHIPTEFNVLIIDGDGSGQFWSLALSPQETVQQYWSVKSASPEELTQIRLHEYDLVLLAGTPTLQVT